METLRLRRKLDRPNERVDAMREAGSSERNVYQRVMYAKDLIFEADAGEKTGFEKYGAFDPKTDTRILAREAIEEIRDAFVYMRFIQKKHPILMTQATEAQRVFLDAYIVLRRLESEERRLLGASQGVSATGS